MSGSFKLSPQDFALLCNIIERVARVGGLRGSDGEDFSQWVHLTLLERNYAPIARFAGRSSLQTFLVVVVRRLLLDWRNATRGKWRPSVWALREGGMAVDLDRLITRDGHSAAEAVAILQDRPGAPPAPVLTELAQRVPARRRRQMVALNENSDSGTVFHDPVEMQLADTRKQEQMRILSGAYWRLTPQERRLLRMRFGGDLKVVSIARALGVPSKPLYQRIERALTSLRKAFSENCAAAPRNRQRPVVTLDKKVLSS